MGIYVSKEERAQKEREQLPPVMLVDCIQLQGTVIELAKQHL